MILPSNSWRRSLSHQIFEEALHVLSCAEHRGASAVDRKAGDDAELMTDIPFKLLGYERGTVALALIFVTSETELVEVRRMP